MTSLLIATALVAQAAQDQPVKPPYKENDVAQYDVQIAINQGGGTLDVEMLLSQAISKATDKEFAGTFGWTDLYVDGSVQSDELFRVVLKPDGTLKSVDSEYGDGMRRMLFPFYMSYPGKALTEGMTWTYKDAKEDEKDAHRATVEYKVAGTDTIKDKKATKVTFKLTEEGPSPTKGTGTYWVGPDGRILKIDADLTGWTVPVAQQVFDAHITCTIKK